MFIKKCSSCKELKNINDFSVDKKSKDGKSYYCKPCAVASTIKHYHKNKEQINLKTKLYRKNHLEKYRKYNLTYYNKNKEKYREYSKNNREKNRKACNKWTKNNPDKVKNKALKRKYNITLDQYNSMLTEQKGVCASCSLVDKRSLAVDHCHFTGKIRGLLCFRCNTTLGRFQDNPKLIKKLSTYIENWKKEDV